MERVARVQDDGGRRIGHEAREHRVCVDRRALLIILVGIAAARSGENVIGLYQTLLQEMPIVPLAFENGQIILRKGLIDNYQPAPYNAFADLETWTSLT